MVVVLQMIKNTMQYNVTTTLVYVPKTKKTTTQRYNIHHNVALPSAPDRPPFVVSALRFHQERKYARQQRGPLERKFTIRPRPTCAMHPLWSGDPLSAYIYVLFVEIGIGPSVRC